jgi:hypothetical protein
MQGQVQSSRQAHGILRENTTVHSRMHSQKDLPLGLRHLEPATASKSLCSKHCLRDLEPAGHLLGFHWRPAIPVDVDGPKLEGRKEEGHCWRWE